MSTEEKITTRVRAKVLAKRYDVSERAILLWAEQGKIPHFRIGKTVRFDLDAVIAVIEGPPKAP